MKQQYDGYHFSKQGISVYNPFSLLNAFKKKEISDYWFKTGTPTFLVKLLQAADYNLPQLKGIYVDESTLTSVDEVVSAHPHDYRHFTLDNSQFARFISLDYFIFEPIISLDNFNLLYLQTENQ